MVLDGRLTVKRQAEPTPETPKEPPGNGLCVREGEGGGQCGRSVTKPCVCMDERHAEWPAREEVKYGAKSENTQKN